MLALVAAVWAMPERAHARPSAVPDVDALLRSEAPEGATAQLSEDAPIFRRFSTPPRRSDQRLRLIQVPVALRPQTDSDAEVDENLGLGYEVGFQPFNRVFPSVAVTFGRMEWRPTHEAVDTVDVKTLDVTQSLNFWVQRTFTIGVGLGLGILDSIVVNRDGTFEHNIVPYIPFRLGVTLSLWDTVFLSLHGQAVPFFAEGYVVGQSRLLFGVGWTY